MRCTAYTALYCSADPIHTLLLTPNAFYGAMRMHSADYTLSQDICLSVRLSVHLFVTRQYCVETTKDIIELLVTSGSYTILVFLCQTL